MDNFDRGNSMEYYSMLKYIIVCIFVFVYALFQRIEGIPCQDFTSYPGVVIRNTLYLGKPGITG